MLIVESKFVGSALHKHENLDLRRTWSFTSGIFYSMTLFTTIGYGTIACGTILGQAFTVAYSIIGIPLMLVVLGDVGNLLLRFVTVTYVFFYLKIRNLFFKNVKIEKEEEFQLPITIAIFVIIIYIMICAAIVHYFDYKEGVYEGLPMWECVYFSSISFMTIGLGDIMPNNIHVRMA
uniref:Potassium channel domain-containing protein n=1 Tax=Panagrolaimus sp. PS1159 TaxID=55785 RepID=A0AC35ETH5_9BILA